MLAALVLAALVAPAQTGLATIQYNAPPPNFAISTGHDPKYLSDLRGKVVVVDFWASWCHVCTEELRDFVRAAQTYGKRVAIVTISSEYPGVASSYLEHWDIPLSVVEDPQGAISRLYSVSKIPITLVLDPAGNVSYVSVGGLSWQELQQAIDLASGTPAALPAAGHRS
ncbi:MAG TPA: TlpA disulfide reductase family protein [Candidatus Cybelea sp.]|nr:TlpA disulfide reductase family protein [Candidatus Cybelea sp.]